MANALYNNARQVLGKLDWEAGAVGIGVMLVKSSYAFNAAHAKVSDLVPASNEAPTSGTNYSRKSADATARTTAPRGTSGAALKIADGTVSWTALNAGTGLKIILFAITGANINDDTVNDLLAYYDTGTNITGGIATTGGDFAINFDATDGAIALG